MTDPMLEKWSNVLLDYCFGETNFAKAWNNGQRRLWIRYEPPANELVKILTENVFERGGNVFLEQIPLWYDYTLYTRAAEEVLRAEPTFELKMLDHIAARLMILSASNTKALATVDPARIGLRRIALQALMAKAMILTEKGGFRTQRCATLFPTSAYAQDSGLSLDEFKDYAYDAMLLNEEDPIKAWKAVATKQEKMKKNWLNTAKTIRVVDTEDATDLKMSVEGHKWIKADGKGNFPSDEIFNAPRKETVNGTITFPRIPQYYRGGPEVNGVTLVFKKGRIVEWKARVGQDYLDKLFEKHPDARYLGEIAFGLHPKIQKISKNLLYDEKIGGTIHIALGQAYPTHVSPGGDRSQLNKSAIHWDMIRDMRSPAASVIINDRRELKWDLDTKRWRLTRRHTR